MRSFAAGLRGQEVQERERERGGLPGSGRGLRQNVAPGEKHGDGRTLHGRRLLVTQSDEGRQQARVQSESAKAPGVCGVAARRVVMRSHLARGFRFGRVFWGFGRDVPEAIAASDSTILPRQTQDRRVIVDHLDAEAVSRPSGG